MSWQLIKAFFFLPHSWAHFPKGCPIITPLLHRGLLDLYKQLLKNSQGMYISMLHPHSCSYTNLFVEASLGTTLPFSSTLLRPPHPPNTTINGRKLKTFFTNTP